MLHMSDDSNKFPPSRKTLALARSTGDIPKSVCIPPVSRMVGVAVCLYLGVRHGWVGFESVVEYCFAGGFSFLPQCWGKVIGLSSLFLGFVLLAGLFVMTVGELAQLQFQIPLRLPRLVVPFEGLAAFPVQCRRRLARVGRNFFRTVALTGLAAVILHENFMGFWSGGTGEEGLGIDGSLVLVLDVVKVALGVAAGVAIWDRVTEQQLFLKKYGRSAEQVRREVREEEGDPEMRNYRRSLHGSLRR